MMRQAIARYKRARRQKSHHQRRRLLRGLETLEDRRLLAVDFGDAPDLGVGTGPGDYRTLEIDNGPSHVVSPLIYMGGGMPDDETDAIANDRANGDDVASPSGDQDDEDGVTNPSIDLTVTVGGSPRVSVSVTNTSGQPAALFGWIDTNGDGVFDNDTERASAEVLPLVQTGSVSLVFPEVPSGFHGETYARFRLSTGAVDLNSMAAQPYGASTDWGEVEDYVAHVVNPVDSSWHCASCEITGGSTEPLLDDYRFGQSVAAIGDVNQDGIDDLAVGVPGYDSTAGGN